MRNIYLVGFCVYRRFQFNMAPSRNSGNRQYCAHCCTGLIPSVPCYSTGTIAGNRHYKGRAHCTFPASAIDVTSVCSARLPGGWWHRARELHVPPPPRRLRRREHLGFPVGGPASPGFCIRREGGARCALALGEGRCRTGVCVCVSFFFAFCATQSDVLGL